MSQNTPSSSDDPSRDDGAARCHVCGARFPPSALRGWTSVNPALSREIEKAAPGWGPDKAICSGDLAKMRLRRMRALLEDDRGQLDGIDRQLLGSFESGQLISRNPEEEASQRETLGARVADRVAEFGGSWTFILSFVAFLALWIVLNAIILRREAFDPYPFILLNLGLSCLAALQAPIIMMSQRRQDAKDRIRSENDYRVNLASELEIRQMHEMIDHHLKEHRDLLAELNQIQAELLREMGSEPSSPPR